MTDDESGATARPQVWVVAALVAFTLLPLAFLLLDLAEDFHEARVLDSGRAVVASGQLADDPRRKWPFQTWTLTRPGSPPVTVTARPADDAFLRSLAAGVTVYSVDGEVVALGDGETRVGAALSGWHGVTFDALFCASVLAMSLMGYSRVRIARRAGLGWSDELPNVRERDLGVIPRMVLWFGIVGVGAIFLFATSVMTAWGLSIACIVVWVLAIGVRRRVVRLRQQGRTEGKHATS